ncbi:hypothetical protein DEU56DRAFT_915626 [Suillus clintonianus]|uniref:uncharacterized protein n=1 Tax=Suillus clintonianus TaxID=1904413 RepID=UPI001B868578|nr:uncharacterized protein DEU56DRAFT_915626 [Suillus clintonianus]KAG2127664.1 hypothetical protein DEU56DRAFT_915626 [Suillus clintonianus]
MPSAETSNKALSDAAAQVLQILAVAIMLQDGNPEHLRFAVQVGNIMTPVFAMHSSSATVVPPVLLSAAMEMQEHLDDTRQWFVSAPVWENIGADDPRIQQHPLKDKARTILVSRPVPSTSTAAVAQSTPGPGPSRPKPKPKPALKKKPAEGKLDKGKAKEVVPPEDVQGDQGRGRTLAIEKRRRDSGSSPTPAPPGGLQSSSGNAAPPPQATFSKKQKIAQDPVPPPADAPQEDITADKDAPELVPHCDQCIKVSVICRRGYGASGGTLKACARCSKGKFKCSRSKIDAGEVPKGQPRRPRSSSRRRPPTQDIVMEADAAAPHAPAYSVPPIATLSPDSRSPDPSSPPTVDPPRQSVVPSLQDSMEVDSDRDAMIDDLQAMTLEVMNDRAALLSKRSGLQESTNSVRAEVAKLQARHTATADLVHALTDRTDAQDADIQGLRDFRAAIDALQNQVNALQEQSPGKNRLPSVLQDAYNALRHRVLGHNQPIPPPFSGPMYHANPSYSGNHSMMPSMGQMQAMEHLYFNLPAGASAMGGPSVGNVAGGSGWNVPGGPSAGRSHNQIAGSSRAGAHAFGESASGRPH